MKYSSVTKLGVMNERKAGNGDDVHRNSVLSGSKSTEVHLTCGESAVDGQDAETVMIGGCDEWRDVEMRTVLRTTTREVARST